MISSEVWMNLESQVKISSTPSVILRTGAIFSKSRILNTNEKLYVQSLIYKNFPQNSQIYAPQNLDFLQWVKFI